MEYQYRIFIARWLEGKETGTRGKGRTVGAGNHLRRYLFEKYGSRCAECGWNRKHPITGRIPLTVEHIDGNAFNNEERNLILLCPGCHALTPTYGALNSGKGRTVRSRDLSTGVVVQREDTCLADMKHGFDPRRLHEDYP